MTNRCTYRPDHYATTTLSANNTSPLLSSPLLHNHHPICLYLYIFLVPQPTPTLSFYIEYYIRYWIEIQRMKHTCAHASRFSIFVILILNAWRDSTWLLFHSSPISLFFVIFVAVFLDFDYIIYWILRTNKTILQIKPFVFYF